MRLIVAVNTIGRLFNHNFQVNIIRKCSHVNIIRYKDCYISSFSPSASSASVILGIVMEYADAGDLHDCIKRRRERERVHFPEPQARTQFLGAPAGLGQGMAD